MIDKQIEDATKGALETVGKAENMDRKQKRRR